MARPRRSLRDRNSAAIAADVDLADVVDLAPPAEEPTPAAPTPAVERVHRPRTAGISSTTRIGIYFRDGEFDDAKSAYLADWSAGGQADTFARWVASTLDRHAARTPQERAQKARDGRQERGSGSTRSFSLPSDSVARMRAAIMEDQRANRWPSDSAWCGDAIAAAVEEARTRAGGVLPAPPARLPNRLAR